MVHIVKQKRWWLILGAFFKSSVMQAAIDNRYLPLFNYPYQHEVQRRSVLAADAFVLMAHEGYAELKGTVPLPELFGKYDMIRTAQALVNTGQPNPLPTAWQSASSLIWDMKGRLSGQGLWLGYEQYCGYDLTLGFKVPLMHVTTQLEFIQTPQLQAAVGLGPDGGANLYTVLNQVNQQLGFNSYQWHTTDFGDFDLYLRWGTVKDYAYRCKHIDLSLKIGALLPITGKVPLDSPVPITLGYYHHYGLYAEADFNCDLKDDWRVGFWLNGTGRFAKKQIRRMPAGQELPQFGAIKGQVYVDPGITIGFAPYVWIDDIRDGFGARASYRLCWHGKDYWSDVRPNDQKPAAQLANVITDSKWIAEWFTVGIVYDLQQNVDYDRHAPFFYLDLDIPTGMVGSEMVSRTYRLAGGFEFHF